MNTIQENVLVEHRAPLMVTISGIRGIWDESLTDIICARYVRAFAKTLQLNGAKKHSEVVVGSDTRESREIICRVACAVLEDEGYRVRYCGIVPTPTVQSGVIHTHASGGLIVTSSHNPRGWNGLKFVASDGLFLAPKDCQTLFGIADSLAKIGDEPIPTNYVLSEPDTGIGDAHIESVMSLALTTPHIHNALELPKLRVALDTINGAGGVLLPRLLERLGCEVVHINSSLDGVFAREPEPTPHNLRDFGAFMRRDGRFDIGLVCDPDADRLALLDETGTPLCEELTLAIATDMLLNRADASFIRAQQESANRDIKPSERTGFIEVVKNLSSSRATDDVVAAFNATRAGTEGLQQARVTVTAVGEVNVAREMQQRGGVIGGEGNGGVLLASCHLGRDSLVGSYLVIHWVADKMLEASKHVPLSELASPLQRWHICKDKAEMEPAHARRVLEVLARQSASIEGVSISTIDGVKLDARDWWVHVRASNTEPIVRVMAEARNEKEAKDLASEWAGRLAQLAKTIE